MLGEAPGAGTAQTATSVEYDGAEPLQAVLDVISVPQGRPVLVVAGWAGADLSQRTRDALGLLMRKVVLPLCREEQVVVVSGGTDAGVMAALGSAAAEGPDGPVLVGVAPDAKLIGLGADAGDLDAARPQPAHRLVRTAGTAWGDESPALVRVAEHIAAGSPVVVLAVGGGAGTAREIALAARRGWPVVLLTGHGGTSDTLAASLRLHPTPGTAQTGRAGRPVVPADVSSALGGRPDHEAQDIVQAARNGLHAAADMDARDGVRRTLRWAVSDDRVLKEAWTRFAAADLAATARKRPTTRLAGGVVLLAALTVVAAVVSSRLGSPDDSRPLAGYVAQGLVLGLPLAAGFLLTLMERRARSGTWVELRAAAEAFVREIYRERSRAADPPGPKTARTGLGAALHEIDRRTGGRLLLAPSRPLGASDHWPPPHLWDRIHHRDCLLGPLTPDLYDGARVLDQLQHFERSAQDFDRKATWLAALIFVAAGIAAFLLALSWRDPDFAAAAAVPATLAAALVSWREYRQRDARVDAMLSTYVAVREARGRWLALPSNDREAPDALRAYANEVEEALAAEGADWERGLRIAHQNLGDRHRR